MADLKKQAEGLEDAARAIRNESRKLNGCRADLMEAWQGGNAVRFGGKMSRMYEELDKTASRLERAAETVRENVKDSYGTGTSQ